MVSLLSSGSESRLGRCLERGSVIKDSCDEVGKRVVEEQHQLFKACCCVKNPKQPWLFHTHEALT